MFIREKYLLDCQVEGEVRGPNVRCLRKGETYSFQARIRRRSVIDHEHA